MRQATRTDKKLDKPAGHCKIRSVHEKGDEDNGTSDSGEPGRARVAGSTAERAMVRSCTRRAGVGSTVWGESRDDLSS
jgi:hypothetical protein